MNYGLIIAGFVILFNPVINVVDIIPDAIGYFLIAAGIHKISAQVSKMSDAYSGYLKLGILDTVKVFSIILLPYCDGTVKPLLSFVFGLLEMLIFVPAVNSMFEGLSYSSMKWNGESVFADYVTKKKKKEQPKTDSFGYIRSYIIFFMAFRECATLLPELTELQLYEYLGTVTRFSRALTYYKPVWYVLATIPVLIIGIKYLRLVTKFFGGIKKDIRFNKAIERDYIENVVPKTTYFISKRMKLSLVFFTCAVLFSFVFRVDGVNLFIGVISAICLGCAALLASKYSKPFLYVLIPSGVRAVLAAVRLILEIRYFSEYSIEAVLYFEKAAKMYSPLAAVTVAENLTALVSVLLYLFMLLKSIKEHQKLFGLTETNAMYSKNDKDIETFNTVGGKALLLGIIAAINHILAAIYPYSAVNSEIFIVVTTAVSLLYIAYSLYAVYVVDDMMYSKELEMLGMR